MKITDWRITAALTLVIAAINLVTHQHTDVVAAVTSASAIVTAFLGLLTDNPVRPNTKTPALPDQEQPK